MSSDAAISYRRALPGDAEALARFSSAQFTRTFGGILYPPRELAAYLATELNAEWYAQQIQADSVDGTRALWVAIELNPTLESPVADPAAPRIVYRASCGGAIVGHILVGPCELSVQQSSDRKFGQVHELYVDPAFHRAGVAARLFDLGLEWLRSPISRLSRPIYISVWESNFRAQAFYMRKHGFVKVGEYDFRIDGLDDSDFVDHEWILCEASV
jgi:ribosomal protein S18 acetylase RimI-like enzyme